MNKLTTILFALCIACNSEAQVKETLVEEKLENAFETIKFVVEHKGDWFYGGEKHLNLEEKEIKYLVGTNTLSISNSYPTTSEGLQGDVDIMAYEIKKDTSHLITFWRSGSPLKKTDKAYNKIVPDIAAFAEELRHYTFDRFFLEPGQKVTVGSLSMKLASVKNNSSTTIVYCRDKTDTLILSGKNLYNSSFEGYHIEWRYPGLVSKRFEYTISKKHKLPVWNYFLESNFFDPEARKRKEAIYRTANKWQLPVNVQFIVSSLSHDPKIQREKFSLIIKQNQKNFAVYRKHFGKAWKKRFEAEVEVIQDQNLNK